MADAFMAGDNGGLGFTGQSPSAACRYSAVRFNRDLKTRFDQLIATGKPARVALVAILRKLILLANALLRDRRPWSEIRP